LSNLILKISVIFLSFKKLKGLRVERSLLLDDHYLFAIQIIQSQDMTKNKEMLAIQWVDDYNTVDDFNQPNRPGLYNYTPVVDMSNVVFPNLREFRSCCDCKDGCAVSY
jgi:hypothetical protein